MENFLTQQETQAGQATSLISEEDRELFKAYFGNSVAYYMARLEKYREGKKIIFNPFAFLLGLWWLVFRKLYVEFFLLLVVILAVLVLELILYSEIRNNDAAILISWFMSGVTYVSFGLFGNYLYLKKASRKVAQAKIKIEDPKKRINYLKRTGGTSMLPFVLVVIALGLIVVYFQSQ